MDECLEVMHIQPPSFHQIFIMLYEFCAFQVHNDDEVRALFKQVQGEVPGSPIFIMKVASQVRLSTTSTQ